MKYFLTSLLLLLVGLTSFGQRDNSPNHIIVEKGAEKDFCLARENINVDILVDSKDSKTVLLAAKLFYDDVERITAYKPEVKNDMSSVSSSCVIIGSIEGSDIIKKLIRKKKIDVSDVKGKWESCLVELVEDPFPGIDWVLIIAGSDRRGTAYGVFELSKQMGVSPWYYFAPFSH